MTPLPSIDKAHVLRTPDERFARVVLANGGLPTGTLSETPRAFKLWRAFTRFSPWVPIGRIVNSGCAQKLSPQEMAAYDAPFPSTEFERAARLFPSFVPTTANQPHTLVRGAGHFLQEDKGPELAQKVAAFIAATPVIAEPSR